MKSTIRYRTLQLEKVKREVLILKHMEGGPNTVKVHEVVHEQGSESYALVMDLIAGEPLNTSAPRPIAFTRHYLKQALDVLAYAHSHGIMHRDVKKGNILVNEDTGQLWLIDWGLAEFYHPRRAG